MLGPGSGRLPPYNVHYYSLSGNKVNKKKVQRINQIKGWQAQSFRRPTRNSYDPEDPNRPVTDPKDTIEEIEPNSCWSTDLTKIHVENVGWANFIPVIANATRECLGWIFSRRGRAVEAKDAIREAVINRFGSESDVPDDHELLSDNGSTFLAHDFGSDERIWDQTEIHTVSLSISKRDGRTVYADNERGKSLAS
jgi:transposase InsO family protein